MDGDTVNLSIGHDQIEVTPLQMACMVAAVANDGKIIQPRLVSRIKPQTDATPENTVTFPSGIVRGDIHVSQRSLHLVRKAMLADVEHPEGTGRRGFIPGYRICGKTGTAKLQKEEVTWFVSFAPYEKPKYAIAVVISAVGGVSGGGTCAPIARQIYQALMKQDSINKPKMPTLVRAE